MNKNSISIVACVLSVIAIITSIVAIASPSEDVSKVAYVEKAEHDKSIKEIEDRILTNLQGSLNHSNTQLKRDIDMVKRIGVLEAKAGITPPASN
jgi:hypothetical protein